jgi:response regulator RpfG family c-di-GMP phosphodiesterase
MGASSSGSAKGAADRLSRLSAAFAENAIGTSATLQALLTRLFRADADAMAHAHRVALLSVRIGEELGMAARALDDLERAAWLHDVGRIAIPDLPGADPEALDDRDANRHRGEQVRAVHAITRGAPFLHPAADLVVASRECFDGSGVPIGLSGSAIPFGARILHVADVFDSLTSLCLTLAFTTESVNVELVRHSGSRFDPEVVAAWLRCLDEAPAGLIPWLSSRERRV